MIDAALHNQVRKIISSDLPERHTFFQLNFFILGKEPTHQAKLKRCIEELKCRKKTIDSMGLEIDELQDRNELLYWEMNNAKFEDDQERTIKCRMADRKILSNNNQIDELKSKVKNCEEEMVFFSEAFVKLSEIEAFKQWDDFEVQVEYWDAKLMDEIKQRMMMRMPIDLEIAKTAMALPQECQVRKQIELLFKNKNIFNIDEVA